jgi:transposase
LTGQRGPKIKLPDVAAKELQEALAGELPGRVRKRLIGLQAIAEGASRPEAAKRAKAGLSTLDNWLRATRRSGWQALMRRMPGTKPKKVKDAARVCRQIRRALSGNLDATVRTRLIAVDRVLGGNRVDMTAIELAVTRASVSLWLRKLRRHGVDALLKKEPPRKRYIEADGAALRALAAKTRDRRYAKALRAIAHLAEGDSIFAAAIKEGASHDTVSRWLEKFRMGGAEALKPVR